MKKIVIVLVFMNLAGCGAQLMKSEARPPNVLQTRGIAETKK